MKRRIRLVKTECKRCGKEIYTTNRAVLAPKAKAKYGPLCEDCCTPEENNEITHAIAREYMGR